MISNCIETSILQGKLLIVYSQTVEFTPNGGRNLTLFKAYEFNNGLILVQGTSKPSYFVQHRSDLRKFGDEVVIEINDTDEVENFTTEQIKETVANCEKYYGLGTVPNKLTELLRK